MWNQFLTSAIPTRLLLPFHVDITSFSVFHPLNREIINSFQFIPTVRSAFCAPQDTWSVLFDMVGYQSVRFDVLPPQIAKVDDSARIWS